VPAAAVIPALIAYIKVVAVKKLVVGFQGATHVGKSPPDVQRPFFVVEVSSAARGDFGRGVRLEVKRG